jgi:hypothetical protein
MGTPCAGGSMSPRSAYWSDGRVKTRDLTSAHVPSPQVLGTLARSRKERGDATANSLALPIRLPASSRGERPHSAVSSARKSPRPLSSPRAKATASAAVTSNSARNNMWHQRWFGSSGGGCSQRPLSASSAASASRTDHTASWYRPNGICLNADGTHFVVRASSPTRHERTRTNTTPTRPARPRSTNSEVRPWP